MLFSCLCWCKGTNFLANHNSYAAAALNEAVVYAGAKVLIFQQITTEQAEDGDDGVLFMLVQRY